MDINQWLRTFCPATFTFFKSWWSYKSPSEVKLSKKKKCNQQTHSFSFLPPFPENIKLEMGLTSSTF